MDTASVVLASSYYHPAEKPQWKSLTSTLHVEAAQSCSEVTEQVVEIGANAGYAAVLGSWDPKFFIDEPTLTTTGALRFTGSGCGGATRIDVRVVDLADFTAEGEPVTVANVPLTIDFASRGLLKRPLRDAARTKPGLGGATTPSPVTTTTPVPTGAHASTPVPSGSGAHAPPPLRTAVSLAAGTPPPPKVMLNFSHESPERGSPRRGATSPPAAGATASFSLGSASGGLGASSGGGAASSAELTGLSAPSIRLFRGDPPRARPRSFSAVVLRVAPMVLMRQWNYNAEYRLLTDARGTPEQAALLLRKIHTAMEQGAVVEVVAPLLDAACRLHTALGGAANLRTAVRLAHLRVQAVGTALGLDMRAPNPVSAQAAQRLASGRQDSLELLVRVLVEGAHLLKLTGSLPDALRYYKTAAAIAGTQGATKGGGTAQIPFLFAAADVQLLRGDLDAAVRDYEEARAHAELANRGSTVVAECEQQLSVVFSLLGNAKEAEIASKRAQAIRRDQRDGTAMAEYLLFEATALAIRGKVPQAAQTIAKARDQSQQAGDKATFVRAAAEALAGVLVTFFGAEELEWSPEVAKECEDATVVAFTEWLEAIGSSDPAAALAAVRERITQTAGSESGLGCLVDLTRATCLRAQGEHSAAVEVASATVDTLTASMTSVNPMLRLAVEIACVSCCANADSDAALRHAERLVWMVNEAPTPIPYDNAFRLSAAVAEAAASVPPHMVGMAGADDMYARLLAIAGEQEGNFSPKLVPMLLDAAEVRHIRGDYPGALELFGKALRIVDHKNLLYLIGPLFQPRWMLSVPEARDRDRLVLERHPGIEGLTGLAMLLQQIALTHEAAGNLGRAVTALQQSIATFEMAAIDHHPGCLSALTNIGRCHLAQSEYATARVYLERADELFLDNYYDFGRYVKVASSVRLRTAIDAGLRAASVLERGAGSLLCKGRPANPALEALELYV